MQCILHAGNVKASSNSSEILKYEKNTIFCKNAVSSHELTWLWGIWTIEACFEEEKEGLTTSIVFFFR